ncbi:MAG TPA: winged helix-turn-helix domain-containing protein [Thermoanaerobaculia bacterium]|nr:winged helix-turn-helix domain-containing protein [Thermoanaerobaculia bacterium]
MSDNSFDGRWLWSFGAFRLDARARLLLRDGLPVPLTPKAFDVLVHLARNENRAVAREELLEAVWPGTVVTDASLTQAVFLVRRALGEAEGTGILETVPRFGYRLNLPAASGGIVEEEPRKPAEPAPPTAAEEADVAGKPAPGPTPALPPAPARRPSPALLGVLAAGALAAAAIAPILLRSPARGGTDGSETGAEALLALQREIAVPPDAQAILGSLDGTVVLSARSAYYLLPADGAHSAVRVPLEREEALAEPLGGGRILLVREGRVVARHPTKAEEADLGPLPPDTPRARPGRLRCSRSGRFLAVRGDETLEVFERERGGWARRLRSRVPFVEGEVLDVGERLVALAQGGGRPVRAFGLPEGAGLLEVPFAERRVSAVAVDDALGRVAVGGPFDSVAVFTPGDRSSPRLLPRRGWTYGLAWIADAPTLLASGLDGITAFRQDAESAAILSTASPGGPLCVDSDAILALVPRRQRLAVVSYSGISPTARVPAGGRPLWAAEHDAEGKTVFAGGRDGELWSLDAASLAIRRSGAHTDGIPSMVRDGRLLATSSDDKTVALWSLPGPELKLRTRAHDFLVNDLTVVDGAGGAELVTASSDGTVRRWSWPGIEPVETIDVAGLLGREVSLHAIAPLPGARRILAGTWSSSLLELVARESGWSVREHPVPSKAVYRLAPVPRLGLWVAVGIDPSSLHLFDLATGVLHPLDAAGLDAMWAVPVPGKDDVVVVGLDGLSRYSFSAPLPDAAGRRTVTYRAWSGRRTGVGLQTATLLPDGSLWGGTVRGELLRFDAGRFGGPPVLTRALDLGTPR